MRSIFVFVATLSLVCVASAQVPENLVADGIPPISPGLRTEIGRYLEFRTASLRGWHPQRREMLITTRFADTAQLHLVKAPSGDRRQLTFGREPIANGSFQPKSGEFLVYTQDSGGGEFHQFYRFDLETGRATLLTDGKSRNGSLRWARGGKQFAYTSTRRSGKDTDIYVMDPRDPKSDRLVLERTSAGWSVTDWSEDETKLLLTEYVSANESFIHLLDLGTREVTPLTPGKGEKIVNHDGRFARDARSIYLLSDFGSEFQRLFQMDLRSGERRVLTEEIPADVDEFELSPDAKAIAFITNENGVGVLRLLDGATNVERPRPQLPIGVPSGLHWHENSRDLGFTLDSARSPSDAYSLDLSTGQVTRWTESETGGLNTARFAEPELVKFASFDGLQISAFVFRPDARKFPGRRPVMISIHGGPEGQARPRFLGRSSYYLEELGCALVFPNVRGSSGYGKTFLTLDNATKREDSVRDIGALLDWIGRDAALDRDRVAVIGGSYGGYMVLASLTHFSDRLRCGIDIVGISNFLTFLKNTQDYRRDLRRVEYGDEREPAIAEFLAKISPLNQVTKISRPLFVVQGKNDPRVPMSEAEQIVKALRERGGTCWYLLANDEGHGFAKKKNIDFQFVAQTQFLREHLLKSPAAEKAQFRFDEWLIAPVRVHFLSSKESPALVTTLLEEDVARILRKMNRVWAQAGIQFRLESLVREEALPAASADAPRENLFARVPAESRSDAAFNIYYVKQLEVNGFYTRRGIFVKDTASLRPVEGGIDEPIPRVSSHELGHALDLPHRQDRTNLMASGTTGTSLNADEIERARSAAKKFSWIEPAPVVAERAAALRAEGQSAEAERREQALLAIPRG